MNLARIGLVMATLGLAGCSGPHSPSAPSAPPAHLLPTLLAGLNRRSPASRRMSYRRPVAWGTITGTQFQPGATVKIGSADVSVVFRDSTTLRLRIQARTERFGRRHRDQSGGLAATLAERLYVLDRRSFDANGEWIAHADGHNDYVTDMRFTIRNNMLISLSCGTPVTMPTTLSVQNGGFSFAGADGLTMSGTLASTTTSYGQVNAPGCGDGRWWADKAPPAQP